MKKKLYLSRTNKKIAGVLGGLGEYIDVDPTFLRVFWIALTVLTGILPGILIYLFVWIVMPELQAEDTTNIQM